jgi:hypothetical protein
MTFCRMLIDDPGNLGGCDVFGGWPWPPGTRWETDAELRKRIKDTLDASDDDDEPPCRCSTLGCGVQACRGECGCTYCHNAYQDFLSDDMD